MVVLQADDYAEFQDGSIVKIIFNNFLTYDHAVFDPGSKLNLIMGPNGTGKSTITCGICLAVGGKPSVLGRSDNICDFVKHGKETGSCEVYIKNSKDKRGDGFVRRFKIQISRSNKSPVYYIDDKKVRCKDVDEYMRKHNIQVENPCTFLAQDKVKSFSEQTPKMLLYNTEKAGPSDLLKNHEKLKDYFKSGEEAEKINKADQDRLSLVLKHLKSKKARADNFAEKEKGKKKVALFRKMITKIKFDNALEVFNEKNTGFEEIERRYNDSMAKEQPLRNTIDEISKDNQRYEQTIADTLEQNLKDYNAIRQKDARWDEDYRAQSSELSSLQENFATMEKDVASSEDPALEQRKSELIQEAHRLSKLRSELNREMANFQSRHDDIKIKQRGQETLFNNKLLKLADRNSHARVVDAWAYYNNNRNLFRYEVFVPYLSMRIKNKDGVMYLNNIISPRDLSMFIFGCKEDEETLRGYRINSTIVDAKLMANLRNLHTLTDEWKRLGFERLAVDLFDAPDPVVSYLNSLYNLDNIPIGGENVDDRAEDIARRLGQNAKLFFSNKSRISWSTSRYNAAQFYTNKSQLRATGFLSDYHALSNHDFNSEIQNVKDQINQLTTRFAKLDEQNAELEKNQIENRKKLDTQQEKREYLSVLKTRIEAMKRKLANMKRDKPDIEQATNAFKERQRKFKEEVLRNIESLNRHAENLRLSISDGLIAILEHDRKRIMIASFEEQIEDLKRSSSALEDELEQRKAEKDRANQALESRTNDLKRIIGIKTTITQKMNKEEKKIFKQLCVEFDDNQVPTDIDQVEDLMDQEQGRLEGAQLEGTQRDVEEYEEMLAESERLKECVAKHEKRKANWENDMRKKLHEWKDPLDLLINCISNHYSEFFKEIGCAGAVRLLKPQNEFDIENYGIEILVKFRHNNSLRPLDHQTQSGGERSVATMLYLLALQEVCPVPFRCVDEINQGMDPTNERRVFDMMVRLLSGDNELAKTQYFLLTPKLLSGLMFNDKVTVLCVYNGPTMKNIKVRKSYLLLK